MNWAGILAVTVLSQFSYASVGQINQALIQAGQAPCGFNRAQLASAGFAMVKEGEPTRLFDCWQAEHCAYVDPAQAPGAGISGYQEGIRALGGQRGLAGSVLVATDQGQHIVGAAILTVVDGGTDQYQDDVNTYSYFDGAGNFLAVASCAY